MKNWKIYTFFCLAFCFLNDLVAQSNIFTDSLAKNYDKNTILLQNSHFEKNEKKIYKGIFNSQLKRELNTFVMSGHEYKRYEQKKWLSFGASVLGAAVLLTSIKDRRINWTQYGIGAGIGLLTIPLGAQSSNHLNRAIWLYNREAILRGR